MAFYFYKFGLFVKFIWIFLSLWVRFFKSMKTTVYLFRCIKVSFIGLICKIALWITSAFKLPSIFTKVKFLMKNSKLKKNRITEKFIRNLLFSFNFEFFLITSAEKTKYWVLANFSPIQFLKPNPKGQTREFFMNFPSSSKKRSGLKMFGSLKCLGFRMIARKFAELKKILLLRTEIYIFREMALLRGTSSPKFINWCISGAGL